MKREPERTGGHEKHRQGRNARLRPDHEHCAGYEKHQKTRQLTGKFQPAPGRGIKLVDI